MTLWLVAVTPTLLPCANELADHPRAGERLAGARRALNRQDRVVELADDANGEVVADSPGAGTKRPSASRGGRRSSSSRRQYGVPSKPPRSHALAEPEQAACEHLRR